MTKQYNAYLKSERWRLKRCIRLRIDSFKCTQCQSKSNLEIHHLTYARFGNEYLSDLITLCRACHAKVDERHARHHKPSTRTQRQKLTVTQQAR